MNWKYIGRAAVCLLLVLVLLFNISPIKAKATGVTVGVAVAVTAAVAIGAALIAIGISPGEDTVAFDSIVDSCQTHLTAQGLIIDGMVNAFRIDTDSPRIGLAENFIRNVLEFVFGQSNTLNVAGGNVLGVSPISFLFQNKTITVQQYSSYPNKLFSVLGFTCSTPSIDSWTGYVIVSNSNSGALQRVESGTVNWTETNKQFGQYYVWSAGSNSSVFSIDGLYLYDLGNVASVDIAITNLLTSAFGPLSITTDEDLVLNDIAPPGVALEDGYVDWTTGSVTVPGTHIGEETEEETRVYPTTLPHAYKDVLGLTQTQAQAGTYSDDSDVDVEADGWLATLLASLTTWFTELINAVKAIPDWFTKVLDGIKAIPDAFTTWFDNVIAGITSLGDIITNAWDTAVTSLLEGIQAIFVPSEDYVSVKVMELCEYFPFVESIIATAEFIRDSVSGDAGPPVIYVDLGAAEGDTNWGGRVVLADFAWYEKYKPTVDTVLSAALWAFFGWRVFMRLPGIIGGESGLVGELLRGKEKTPGGQTAGRDKKE